jgi:hypothetical protein
MNPNLQPTPTTENGILLGAILGMYLVFCFSSLKIQKCDWIELLLFETGGSFGVLFIIIAIVLIVVLCKRRKAKRKQEGMFRLVVF